MLVAQTALQVVVEVGTVTSVALLGILVVQTALQVVVGTVALGFPLGILVAQTVVVEVGTVEWGAPFGILVAPVLPGMLELAVEPAAAAGTQIAEIGML